MEMSPFSYKIVTSTQFSELLLCLLFLKNNQFETILVFPGVSDGKKSACSAGDPGSIPGWGRYPGRGNGNPLQYSCLENAMDGGAWDSPWGPKESDMTERLHLCKKKHIFRWQILLPFRPQFLCSLQLQANLNSSWYGYWCANGKVFANCLSLKLPPTHIHTYTENDGSSKTQLNCHQFLFTKEQFLKWH